METPHKSDGPVIEPQIVAALPPKSERDGTVAFQCPKCQVAGRALSGTPVDCRHCGCSIVVQE